MVGIPACLQRGCVWVGADEHEATEELHSDGLHTHVVRVDIKVLDRICARRPQELLKAQ